MRCDVVSMILAFQLVTKSQPMVTKQTQKQAHQEEKKKINLVPGYRPRPVEKIQTRKDVDSTSRGGTVCAAWCDVLVWCDVHSVVRFA